MRRAIVALLTILRLLVPGAKALAQDYPGDTVIVDTTFPMKPGTDLRECFEVPASTRLTVIAWSPEGRTGETAHLLFNPEGQNARPPVYLTTNLTPDQTISTYMAQPGTYCYYVTVTHTLDSILPPDEQPYKNVFLKIVSDPVRWTP